FQIVPNTSACTATGPANLTGNSLLSTWLQVSPNSIVSNASVAVGIATGDANITGAAAGATLIANVVIATPNAGLNCPNPLAGGWVANLGGSSQCVETITYKVTIQPQPKPTVTPASLTFDLIKGGGGTPPNQLSQNLTVALNPAPPSGAF